MDLKIQEIVNMIFKAGVTLSDIKTDTNSILHERLQKVTLLLKELEELDYDDYLVPMNVIEYSILIRCVDNGMNPDLIKRDQLQTIIDKNQKTNGRLKSIKLFHDELRGQMRVHFPEL
jgi:hypothetical protein